MGDDFYEDRSPVTGEPTRPMEQPRYSGLPSFMRAPIADELGGLDVALVGVPFDAGVTNRPGARLGPREIRNQSSGMRSIHPSSRVNPYETCRVADVGDVAFANLFDLAEAHRAIERFFRRIVKAGVLPLTAGGDHSISYPILQAVAADRPVALIQIDAHTDTWDEFMGSRLHHGAPFRRAVEDGLIDPQRTVQIGIRGAQNVTDGWDYSEQHGMRLVFMHELAERGIESVLEQTRAIVGGGPVYLSFDIDGIDPAFAPGTGTPEIGGLTTLEAQRLVRGLAGLDLIGADVVEVAPPLDPSGMTALVGATIMYEALCLLARKDA